IGDPSDRDSARDKLTREDAKANIAEWVKHISCLIDFDDKDNPAEVVTNSTWFDAMSTTEMVEMLSNSTVQQMIERDMFQKRLQNNKPIFLHEFIYPMFQGYDSVALDIDVEMCGTDQTFNALCGRDLSKKLGGKDKFVMVVNLMENPKTGDLMSKSKGTGVFLGTDANTMFGEIMSQPDEMIEILLINNTRVSLEDIEGLNIAEKPRDAKLFTAVEIVKVFHEEENALEAKQAFIDTFSKKQFPEDAKKIQINETNVDVFQLCKACLSEQSNSELRRLIQQGSVSIFGEKYSEAAKQIEIKANMEVKIGKRGFFKIN
ncbi:MAG: tyrosine--tRNA ligase, partial [Proteobacteria bacterium]|nr:tyrosine--tRNA ligase [Pseudomonadota bacterium]